MVKLPPERLAAALKANLKRRKQLAGSVSCPDPAKDPEEYKENPSEGAPRPPKGT